MLQIFMMHKHACLQYLQFLTTPKLQQTKLCHCSRISLYIAWTDQKLLHQTRTSHFYTFFSHGIVRKAFFVFSRYYQVVQKMAKKFQESAVNVPWWRRAGRRRGRWWTRGRRAAKTTTITTHHSRVVLAPITCISSVDLIINQPRKMIYNELLMRHHFLRQHHLRPTPSKSSPIPLI